MERYWIDKDEPNWELEVIGKKDKYTAIVNYPNGSKGVKLSIKTIKQFYKPCKKRNSKLYLVLNNDA